MEEHIKNEEGDMGYSGSCHCGAIAFTVALEPPTSAMSCNCSHCRRKGLLLSFVSADSFALERGDEALTDYFFNRHAIGHRFCRTCGCQPFSAGKGPEGAATVAVNLRCVPNIDLDSLEIERVNGADF